MLWFPTRKLQIFHVLTPNSETSNISCSDSRVREFKYFMLWLSTPRLRIFHGLTPDSDTSSSISMYQSHNSIHQSYVVSKVEYKDGSLNMIIYIHFVLYQTYCEVQCMKYFWQYLKFHQVFGVRARSPDSRISVYLRCREWSEGWFDMFRSLWDESSPGFFIQNSGPNLLWSPSIDSSSTGSSPMYQIQCSAVSGISRSLRSPNLESGLQDRSLSQMERMKW